jgi:NADH-quinone oxidoreductase subunit G
MCMVEIEGMPKLQAACSTQVMKDGMVVRTQSPAAKEAQRAIMEFLLINHPLDCPICDQAGECGLQDYSFKHGQAFSRFRFEEKRTYPRRSAFRSGRR